MKVDFTVKPEWTGMGSWDMATVRINTKKAAEAYNEWYGTERRINDSFKISSSSYKEFEMMVDASRLSRIFG